jgi:hypothetical protein
MQIEIIKSLYDMEHPKNGNRSKIELSLPKNKKNKKIEAKSSYKVQTVPYPTTIIRFNNREILCVT